MIQGRFGDKAQVYFDIELIDENGLFFPVEVMIDTGFTGFLAMNKQDRQSLDWRFLRQNKLKTAQVELFLISTWVKLSSTIRSLKLLLLLVMKFKKY